MTALDKEVAEWMDQLGFNKGEFYYTHRETEMDISDDEATFFYTASRHDQLLSAINEVKMALDMRGKLLVGGAMIIDLSRLEGGQPDMISASILRLRLKALEAQLNNINKEDE